ncbi:hypothetical protein V5799_031908 [Amblyomma americanum]|uniref:Uncharacterized protein n=1 Tax=Amblyomma americanum TaxID=6943 RepID=A0AAQ4DSP0_AMBAM
MDLLCPGRLEGRDLLASEEFDCNDGFGHGVFQRRMLALYALSLFCLSSHIYSIPLIAKDVDHWCKRPPHANVSTLDWKHVAIPLEADGHPSRCRMYEHPNDLNDTSTVPCTAWDYDDELAVTSVVSQWDLVCDRKFMLYAVPIVSIFSVAAFGITAGSAADARGRRPVLMTSVGVLLVSTVGLCVATTYAVHSAMKVIASGSVSAANIVTGVLLFEVTTHENRPLHVVVAGAVAVVITDLWGAIMGPMKVHWALKQAVFLAPTYLSASTLCLVIESPRWLVSKARYRATEDAMLAAADANKFPLQNTASLMNKLKAKAAGKSDQSNRSFDLDVLQGVSVRKRSLVAFFSCFSIYFVLRVVVLSSVMRAATILPWISFGVVALSLAAMLFVITKVTMLVFISTCFAMLGVVLCLLSLASGLEPVILSQALAVCAKALGLIGNIVWGAYSLELFPTAVRGTAFGWIYGFGGLGAVSAAVIVRLKAVGREDVVFAVSGSLMFASLLAVGMLPRNTTVECARTAVRRASFSKQQSMEHMRNTLEVKEDRATADTGSLRGRNTRRDKSRSKKSTPSSGSIASKR